MPRMATPHTHFVSNTAIYLQTEQNIYTKRTVREPREHRLVGHGNFMFTRLEIFYYFPPKWKFANQTADVHVAIHHSIYVFVVWHLKYNKTYKYREEAYL